MMRKVPFLVGPTASGKTAVALIVAERINAEIISADSRQLYRGMRIGAAQPTAAERRRVPHHFVNCLDPQKNFSAGEYSRQARAKISTLQDHKIIPLVVGGSGLYISALAGDFFSGPAADPDIRNRLKTLAAEKGVNHLYAELRQIDPDSAAKILPGDYRRIERALEIFYLTGIPISKLRKQRANPAPFEPVMVGLNWRRTELYERINARCLQMLQAGLVREVKILWSKYPKAKLTVFREINALNSVGYAEVLDYLAGEVTYEEMVRLFQRNTRRFAKRQLSWFRRDQRIAWIDMTAQTTPETAAKLALAIFAAEGIAS